MAHFEPLCDDQELLGITVMSYPKAINYENFAAIYAKHGLNHVDPNKWYPARVITDVINDIIETSVGMDAMMDFVSIGMAMIDEMASMLPPPGQASLEEVMFNLDKFRASVNRGTDPGYLKVEKVSDTHLVVHTRTIAPDDVDYGNYYALARRYLPARTPFTVHFDEKAPRHDDGAAETVIHIRWS